MDLPSLVGAITSFIGTYGVIIAPVIVINLAAWVLKRLVRLGQADQYPVRRYPVYRGGGAPYQRGRSNSWRSDQRVPVYVPAGKVRTAYARSSSGRTRDPLEGKLTAKERRMLNGGGW